MFLSRVFHVTLPPDAMTRERSPLSPFCISVLPCEGFIAGTWCQPSGFPSLSTSVSKPGFGTRLGKNGDTVLSCDRDDAVSANKVMKNKRGSPINNRPGRLQKINLTY